MKISSLIAYSFAVATADEIEDFVPKTSVLIVPGLMGTRMNLKGDAVEFKCDYYQGKPVPFDYSIWVDVAAIIRNMKLLKSGYFDCWKEALSLKISRDNAGNLIFGKTSVGGDAELSVLGEDDFSLLGIESLAKLGPFNMPFTKYFSPMIKSLARQKLERDVDIKGASYDWRMGVYDYNFSKWVTEIEAFYNKNGRPTLLISHSQGAQYVSRFLNSKVTEEWKKKYILGWISVNGAFGGSSKAARAITGGVDMVPKFLLAKDVHDIEKNVPSLFQLALINGKEFTGKITFQVNEQGPVYDASNWHTFFPEGSNQRIMAEKVVKNSIEVVDFLTRDPGVPVVCISSDLGDDSTVRDFSINVDADGSPDTYKEPKVLSLENGDSTLGLWSQEVCRKWKSAVFSYRFDSREVASDHLDIVTSPFVSYLTSAIYASWNYNLFDNEDHNNISEDAQILRTAYMNFKSSSSSTSTLGAEFVNPYFGRLAKITLERFADEYRGFMDYELYNPEETTPSCGSEKFPIHPTEKFGIEKFDCPDMTPMHSSREKGDDNSFNNLRSSNKKVEKNSNGIYISLSLKDQIKSDLQKFDDFFNEESPINEGMMLKSPPQNDHIADLSSSDSVNKAAEKYLKELIETRLGADIKNEVIRLAAKGTDASAEDELVHGDCHKSKIRLHKNEEARSTLEDFKSQAALMAWMEEMKKVQNPSNEIFRM